MTPRERLAAIEAEHYAIALTERDETTDAPHEPGTGHDLPPICGGCSDWEIVGAIEYGEMVGATAGVPWPCDAATLAAFARAVLDATDAALEEPGRVGEIRRFSLCRTVDRLADEHLGSES